MLRFGARIGDSCLGARLLVRRDWDGLPFWRPRPSESADDDGPPTEDCDALSELIAELKPGVVGR
jgi:hypothetical protein